MKHTVFIPCDSAALAAGAEEVAQEIIRLAEEAGIAINIKRNGSRGMFWLEPLGDKRKAHNQDSKGFRQGRN